MVLVMNIAASQKELNYLISEERKQNKIGLGIFIPVIPWWKTYSSSSNPLGFWIGEGIREANTEAKQTT